MKPIANLITRCFIYCLYSREIVFENICMRDLARTAIILHTAKSFEFQRLRRLEARLAPRMLIFSSESFELESCLLTEPIPTVIERPSFERVLGLFETVGPAFFCGDTLMLSSVFFADKSAYFGTSDSICTANMSNWS